MLKKSDENILALLRILAGTLLVFHKYDVCYSFFVNVLYQVEDVPLYSSLLRVPLSFLVQIFV